MRNPLNKRIPRELRRDAGKYIVLFLFLAMTISLVCGFLVADNSMQRTYDQSFEKYNIEDGHFITGDKISKKTRRQVEDQGVTLHQMFYKDRDEDDSHRIRLFPQRTEVNKVDLLRGEFPKAPDEVGMDRLHAEKNGRDVGDTVEIAGKTYRLTGIVALSDYSTMFENNADIMFDSTHFGVGILTEEGFKDLKGPTTYCYSWKIRDEKDMSPQRREDIKEDIMDVLTDRDEDIEAVVQREDNQAIMFSGDDLGSDKGMFLMIMCILLVVLAFVYGITTRSTLEQEAGAIGTLRASGYTKGEMVRHYLKIPALTTLLAALVGNILGYGPMKKTMAGLYLNSYSFTSYETYWNSEAFLITTVAPVAIISVVVMFILLWTLRLPPLNFLKHEMKIRRNTSAMPLRVGRFITRFRTRVILQNKVAYILLFIGIFCASALLMFSLFMRPLLTNYADRVDKSQIARYQYIMKAPVPTDCESAEPYAVTSLEVNDNDEISVFGIRYHSRYLKDLELPEGENEVVATTGYMEKYKLKVGDTITLKKKFSSEEYTFRIASAYDYDLSFALFMTRPNWRATFDEGASFFNGYYSDEEITDIDDEYIATVITETDLKKVTTQLMDSMGGFFYLLSVFSAILYCLLIYLLAKMIVDKNADSISMLKILGYTHREAGNLYNSSTAVVVFVSLLICTPVMSLVLEAMYSVFMMRMHGWVSFYIAPKTYWIMIGAGIVCYYFVHKVLMFRVRRIPMSLALKNME